MPFAEERAFLDKKVSVLNLLSLGLSLDEATSRVSTEKTTTIEDMIDMCMANQSKVPTFMNTIELCKTKENALECITGWLSILNHNFV
eukprot:13528941-Ditylum_brightwellii.AAC.1